MSDEKRSWSFLTSIETNLGWNSSWGLRDKNKISHQSLLWFCLLLYICLIHDVKNSDYIFFGKGVVIAMVFINAWCEMIRSPKYKHIAVYRYKIIVYKIQNKAVCTALFPQPATSGMWFAPLWLPHLLLWSCHQNSVVTECLLTGSWLLKYVFTAFSTWFSCDWWSLLCVRAPMKSSELHLKLIGWNGGSLYSTNGALWWAGHQFIQPAEYQLNFCMSIPLNT